MTAGELRDIQRRTGVTTIAVLPNQNEVLSLADWVGRMLNGRFLQVDHPTVPYQKPATLFVEGFWETPTSSRWKT